MSIKFDCVQIVTILHQAAQCLWISAAHAWEKRRRQPFWLSLRNQVFGWVVDHNCHSHHMNRDSDSLCIPRKCNIVGNIINSRVFSCFSFCQSDDACYQFLCVLSLCCSHQGFQKWIFLLSAWWHLRLTFSEH